MGTLEYNRQERVIDQQLHFLTAGVIGTLPVDAVLGWDLPIILHLLLEAEPTEEIDSGEWGKANVKVACTQ